MSYDAQEAARLISWSNRQAGIGPLTEAELIQWIDDGVGLLEWEDVWEEDGVVEKYIDFPTLISLQLICLLRHQTVLPEEITAAAPLLGKTLGVEWPYASQALWDLQQLPASLSKNETIEPIIRGIFRCLERLAHHKLEFGDDGIACAWSPFKGIVVDPRVVSGSPCVVGTRTPTWVFPGMLEGGDTVKVLANGYRLSEEQVRNALDWERQLDAASS